MSSLLHYQLNSYVSIIRIVRYRMKMFIKIHINYADNKRWEKPRYKLKRESKNARGELTKSPDVRISAWIYTIFSYKSKTISQVKSNCDIQFGFGFFSKSLSSRWFM